MSLDTVAAAEVFAASADWTVGLEEEFAILDPVTLEMVPRYEELRDEGQSDDVLADSIAGELISSEIEIRSGRGDDLADALARQRELRQRLFAVAGARGVALGATGTHPWADYREQPNIDTEHYRRVVEGLQYVARRNNTFSLHVHVGLRDVERAVRACDRLRRAGRRGPAPRRSARRARRRRCPRPRRPGAGSWRRGSPGRRPSSRPSWGRCRRWRPRGSRGRRTRRTTRWRGRGGRRRRARCCAARRCAGSCGSARRAHRRCSRRRACRTSRIRRSRGGSAWS